MNFVIALPPSQGYTKLMVIVDKLSKFNHFIPLKSDYISQSVADSFIKDIVKMNRFPMTIISNHDRISMSALNLAAFIQTTRY